MRDIDEFAREVARRTITAQKVFRESFGAQFDLAVDERAVGELVKAAYYASMIPDEGRYPMVRLMSYRKDFDRAFHYRFRSPCEPTAVEIAKLAHASNSGSHLCVISENGKFLLDGIDVTVLDDLRHFGYSSFRVGNPFILAIKGPGHISAGCGGSSVIYNAGNIVEEEPLLFGKVLGALAASVEAELKGRAVGAIESLNEVFNDIVGAIARLGHGGLLLVAKRPDMCEFSSSREIDCSLLQRLLLKYWQDVANLLAEVGGVANLLERRMLQASPRSQVVASSTTMLENGIRSIGQLAGMDGAIVMDYSCNVVAFNAIITKDAKGAEQARLVDHLGNELREVEVLKNRGSRHKSALSYISRVPDSFALVISQDGGVSAFHNRADGTVLCEHGLQVLE